MHTVLAVVVSLVVGGALGYAFRGKEHAALQSAEAAAVSKVQGEAKKL